MGPTTLPSSWYPVDYKGNKNQEQSVYQLIPAIFLSKKLKSSEVE